MKVGLYSTAGQMDKKDGEKHLSAGHNIFESLGSGIASKHYGGIESQDRAQDEGEPHVDMDQTIMAGPSIRRNDQRDQHSRDPLRYQQAQKQKVGVLVSGLTKLLVELFGSIIYF